MAQCMWYKKIHHMHYRFRLISPFPIRHLNWWAALIQWIDVYSKRKLLLSIACVSLAWVFSIFFANEVAITFIWPHCQGSTLQMNTYCSGGNSIGSSDLCSLPLCAHSMHVMYCLCVYHPYNISKKRMALKPYFVEQLVFFAMNKDTIWV